MEFLEEYLFTDLKWLMDAPARKFSAIDEEKFCTSIYASMFNDCAFKTRNLLKHEGILGDEAYTFQDMNDDFYRIIFSKSLTGNSLPMNQRIMQAEYLKVLMLQTKEKSPELLMVITSQLEKISQESKRAASVCKDQSTKNHFTGMASIIDAWISNDNTKLIN